MADTQARARTSNDESESTHLPRLVGQRSLGRGRRLDGGGDGGDG